MIEIKAVDHELFKQRIEEYCQLYKMCFNQEMTVGEAKWRYLDHPQKEIYAYFALDDGKLVASYSASPLEVRVSGNIWKAILSLNTMTHPDYTGRGLFVELAECVYQLARERGCKMVFGFPNYISNRTFVSKLGWKDIYEIPTMELLLDERVVNRLSKGLDDVYEDPEFALDYSTCHYGQAENVAVEKSGEFLQWRYGKNPVNHYRNFVCGRGQTVRSYIVCKEYKERLNIIDYFFADAKDMERLVSWCVVYADRIGKSMVTTWAKLGDAQHLYLEKLGFKNNYPITYMGANVFQNDEPCVYDYHNWVVRMGDDNVY